MAQDQTTTRKNRGREDWLAILDEFGVQFLLLDRRRDSALFQLIRSRPDWIIDFKDGEKVLFARSRSLEDTPAAA